MSKIEWTDVTWNPTTGCNKISPGCKHCYALTMHKRLKGMGQRKYQKDFDAGVQTWEDELMKPLSWKKPSMVFVNSMSDLFHEDVTFEFIEAVFSVMSDVDRHIYQVLTKRAERMYQFFQWMNERYGGLWRPKANVWLGVSVENQKYADERIPYLLKCNAHIKFLSCEPLLGPVDLKNIEVPGEDNLIYPLGSPFQSKFDSISRHNDDHYHSSSELIDWVIVGGESGHGARPMHPDWVRSLRHQCVEAGVPFFFKQWGEYAPHMDGEGVKKISISHDGNGYPMCKVGKKKAGRELDGRTWDEMPVPIRYGKFRGIKGLIEDYGIKEEGN